MSNLTKGNNETIQRSKLHRKIWAIADDVRGAVDGWDFKQYKTRFPAYAIFISSRLCFGTFISTNKSCTLFHRMGFPDKYDLTNLQKTSFRDLLQGQRLRSGGPADRRTRRTAPHQSVARAVHRSRASAAAPRAHAVDRKSVV